MPGRILGGLGLVAVTVAVHALGLVTMLRWVRRSPAVEAPLFWSGVWLLIRVAWCLIALHLIEITVWAAFFWWQDCQPDFDHALYFSGVTYATIGYGDLLLPAEWRLLAPVEGLTGILMCGLSTAFFFWMMTRLYGTRASQGQS